MSEERRPAIGLDVGTYTVQAARRSVDGGVQIREEINGFIQIPGDDRNKQAVAMVKKSGAPMIQRGDDHYVLGSAALKIAYAWSSADKKFRRPMKDGILSVEEKDAFNILAVVIRSLVSPVEADGTVVAYSVPAAPINSDRDPEYHGRTIQSILDSSDFGGKKVKAIPCGEARAVVMAELADKAYTGFGFSFGAGMVNACLCVFGAPVFEFSLVGSGDWIDREASRACGEEEVFINQKKMEVDITGEPKDHVERSIITHYSMLIDRVGKLSRDGLAKAKIRTTDPYDVIVAGGTASPKGFLEMFEKRMKSFEWGDLKLGEFRLAEDHAHAIARGLLAHAEIAEL